MINKLKYMGLALAIFAGTSIALTPEAEARRGAQTAGIVAGTVIGLGILGAYAHAREHNHGYYRSSCYKGRERCEVVGQRCWYGRYGDYRCKDDVRCYRPTICD